MLCNKMKKENCSSPTSVDVNALEAMKPPYEDAYQHMRAQCRSTGPGHWARPRTWWRWSRVACNLDCIQTAPPCQCQSRSPPASRSVALGLSCTEWSLSWGQLWGGKEKEQERTEDRRQKQSRVVGVCGGTMVRRGRQRNHKAFANLLTRH